MDAMNFVSFVKLLVSECSSDIKHIFYQVPGLELKLGLRTLKTNNDLAQCVEVAAKNDNVVDIYVSHSVFDFCDATSSSRQHVDNVEQNDASDSNLDDDDYNIYEYDSKSEESDTASVDHLSDDVICGKKSKIYNGLPRDGFVEKDVSADKDVTNKDNIVNNPRRLLAKCCRDAKDRKCPFRLWASWMQNERSFQIKKLNDEHSCSRTYEYGTLITSNWIARNFAKKIMMNPCIKVKEITDDILKKYKCKVEISQAIKGKNESFRTDGWLQGCRRVIGIDGCFLKTIYKGELLSVVGRDGNNQIYPIAWTVVSVENKDNWVWFMELLISDLGLPYGQGLTITSDQHKVMPMAEHRQCARHIYTNFRKKYTRVLYRNLFWQAAKATYPHNYEKDFGKSLQVVRPALKLAVTGTGEDVTASVGNVCASGGMVTARGGSVTARGGKVTARGGSVTARGGKVTVRGGKVTASGGIVSAIMGLGGKVSARGEKVSATPSTPDSASIVVSSKGVAMQTLRPGVFIRSPEKVGSSYADTGSSSMNGLRTVNGKVVSSRGRGDGSKSRMYPHGIRPIGFGVSWDPIDGQTMLGDSMGIPRPAWPEGITPQDCIIEAATQSEIAISQSPPVESQEQEAPMQE
ncbi:multidrug resistance-associated protein 5 [Tanacetum coccineum]